MEDVDVRNVLVESFERKGERYAHFNLNDMEQYIIACALQRYYKSCSKVMEDYDKWSDDFGELDEYKETLFALTRLMKMQKLNILRRRKNETQSSKEPVEGYEDF